MTELSEMITDLCRTQIEEYLDLQNRAEYARQMSAELEKEREAENG